MSVQKWHLLVPAPPPVDPLADKSAFSLFENPRRSPAAQRRRAYGYAVRFQIAAALAGTKIDHLWMNTDKIGSPYSVSLHGFQLKRMS